MSWKEEFEAATSARVLSSRSQSGGDIGESHCVALEDGTKCFVKVYPDAPPGQTEAEAAGLRWLAEPGVIRVAEVVAVGSNWLALAWIEAGPMQPHSAVELGRGLGRLHATGSERFGLDHDNWIGSLPQNNHPGDDWPCFYGERRLHPLVESAARKSLLPQAMRRDFESLLARLPELVGPPEKPARLHGDLWSGNVLYDENGSPWLIDPAAYAGHREVDLAMMKLFGGFSAETDRAYAEEFELAPGAAARVALYQLYPLLVHLNLFGESYCNGVAGALQQALEIA
ncbi:MAG: fructosamine kinase family protein [Myxococcota bacterium]